jgi:hypothetical protein
MRSTKILSGAALCKANHSADRGEYRQAAGAIERP